MKRIKVDRIIGVAQAEAWAIISDVGRFHEVAPNLHQVKILSGNGKGLVRQCIDNDGKSWKETCVVWNEGHSYAFQVNTQARDYPFPFKYLRGTFSVESVGSTTSRIQIVFEFKYKHQLLMWFLAPLARKKGNTMLQSILANWERSILERRSS